MKPTGENLTAKQEAALVALLSHGTIEAAYASVGVSKTTMWRWMQLPRFQSRYKAERRQLVEAGIVTLQKHATTAARVLVQIADDTEAPASARVTAAKTILDQSVSAIEMTELLQRIERLEVLAEANDKGKTKRWG
jgi:hypothetical protein